MVDEMKTILNLLFISSAFFANTIEGFPHSDSDNSQTDASQVGSSNEYDFMRIVKSHGYSAEAHHVESDGYNLVLHRISGSPAHPPAPGKKVVYFQHGLFMWTVNFVLKGPQKDLAFMLADAGYDVWMGNARGNTYSRSHKTLQPEDAQFWDFSYHEIALGDIKSFIDYALNTTNQKKLTYIGYSSGSTEGFVLLSSLPEYNDKINLLIDISPIVFWKHNRGALINTVSTALGFAENIHYYFGLIPQELFSKTGIIQHIEEFVCKSEFSLMEKVCETFLHSLSPDENFSRLNKTMLAIYLITWPAGASAKTLFHLGQNMRDGNFRAYDYGHDENIKKYGTDVPPKYPLEKVTVPVAMYFGDTDIYSVMEDIDDLKKSLPNVVEYKKVEDFSHFLWSDHIKEKIYDPIVKLVSNYTSGPSTRKINVACFTTSNEPRPC